MNRTVLFVSIISAFFTARLSAQNITNRPALVPRSESPDKSFGLFQVVDARQRISEIHLMSLKRGAVNQSFPLSSRVRMWAAPVRISVIWSDDNAAGAFEIADRTNSEAYACVKSKDGTLKAVDLTATARGSHLGVLGRPGSDFSRAEHAPVRWGTWSAQYGRILEVRSHFWDKKGKRFTVSTPFLIGDKGEIGTQ